MRNRERERKRGEMKRGARKRRGVEGRERERGARKEGRKRDRKCERQRGDAGDRVQLPTYGGEGRLVCSSLFHPREPPRPTSRLSFSSVSSAVPACPQLCPPLESVFLAPTYESLPPSPSSPLRRVSFSLSARENKFTVEGGRENALSLPLSSPVTIPPPSQQQSSSLVRRFECN